MNDFTAPSTCGHGSDLSPASTTCDPTRWLIWQLLDSSFPAGGFAHSGGIEAASAHGMARDRLEELVRQSLLQSMMSGGPFASGAYDAPDVFPRIDWECDAFLTGDVANRASRRQGAAMLRAAASIFDTPALRQAQHECPSVSPGHLFPVFGLICQDLDVSRLMMHEMLAFTSLRAALSAATRLGIVGPLEAQRLLIAIAADARRTAHQTAALRVEEATQTSPLLEIVQGTHDRLYSRLFQS